MTMHHYTPEEVEALSRQKLFQDRVEGVLDLAYHIMTSPQGRRYINSKVLYKVLGRPGTPYGDYFSTFFRQTGGYVTKKMAAQLGCTAHPFAYEVNEERLPQLQAHKPTHTYGFWSAERGMSFLTDPGPRGGLPRTGDRVYPWWATMATKWRHKLFLEEHEVLYDYDIANAKSSLILQAYDALRADKHLWTGDEWEVPTWRAYVKDKHAIRRQLMDDLGWDKHRVKHALQAIGNGAYVGSSGALAYEWELQKHHIYTGLRSDYQCIAKVFSKKQRHGDETAGQCLQREYLAMEDAIMDVVSSCLKPGQWAWWVHDGWMSKSRVETGEIQSRVRTKLGLDIQIEEEEKSRHTGAQGGQTANNECVRFEM